MFQFKVTYLTNCFRPVNKCFTDGVKVLIHCQCYLPHKSFSPSFFPHSFLFRSFFQSSFFISSCFHSFLLQFSLLSPLIPDQSFSCFYHPSIIRSFLCFPYLPSLLVPLPSSIFPCSFLLFFSTNHFLLCYCHIPFSFLLSFHPPFLNAIDHFMEMAHNKYYIFINLPPRPYSVSLPPSFYSSSFPSFPKRSVHHVIFLPLTFLYSIYSFYLLHCSTSLPNSMTFLSVRIQFSHTMFFFIAGFVPVAAVRKSRKQNSG